MTWRRVIITLLSCICIGVMGFTRTPTPTAFAVGPDLPPEHFSLLELSGEEPILTLRESVFKTLIYVEKIYFVPGSDLKRDLVVGWGYNVQITNTAGEWARVWLEYDIVDGRHCFYGGAVWEWRTFTNAENWTLALTLYYSTGTNTSYKITTGETTGAYGCLTDVVGYYALPSTTYGQIVKIDDLLASPTDYPLLAEQANTAMTYIVSDDALPSSGSGGDGEVTRPTSSDGNGVVPRRAYSTTVTIATAEENLVQRTQAGEDYSAGPKLALISTCVLIFSVAVLVTTIAIVASDASNDGNQFWHPPPITPEVEKQINAGREFDKANDTPSDALLARLVVTDHLGAKLPVTDHASRAVYYNTKTYHVGNQWYAMLDPTDFALIKYNAQSRTITSIVGAKITCKDDHKLITANNASVLSFRDKGELQWLLFGQFDAIRLLSTDEYMYRMTDIQGLSNAKHNADAWGTWMRSIFGEGWSWDGVLFWVIVVATILGIIIFRKQIWALLVAICSGIKAVGEAILGFFAWMFSGFGRKKTAQPQSYKKPKGGGK